MSETISTLRQRLRSGQSPATDAPMPVRRQAMLHTESMLTRLLRRPAAWVRRHERFACCIVAVLDIVDKDVPVDGLVTVNDSDSPVSKVTGRAVEKAVTVNPEGATTLRISKACSFTLLTVKILPTAPATVPHATDGFEASDV
jgi:hypothetical protein